MTHRVFQWASGTVGRHAARAILDRPSLELAGLHVLSATKVGQDVGTILEQEALGITATSDIETIKASDADIVIHAPLASMVYGDDPDQDIQDICELLAAGKDVITVVGYMYPKVYGPALMSRLEQACQSGKSTFHSTGLNPGWMGDLIPLTMSALSERIDHIHVLEISNFQGYPSPEIMFDAMGFGSAPDVFEANNTRRSTWLNGLFSESVQMVADGIGLGVDDVSSTLETALAPADLDTASGVVKKGTVAGQHWRWSGYRDGIEVIAHETIWRMHDSVALDWATGKHSVRFSGNPDMFIEFEGNYVSDGLLATAMHAVNAIPLVRDADPGVKTFLDLPWIMGQTG
jgi:hypothetical protein